MPEASFDKKLNLPSDGGKFFKLSKKGDKIKFIIAKTPHYTTKHFISDKEVVLCAKFNSDDPSLTCKWCEQYHTAKDRKDEATEKRLKPVTNFYYPVVNLDLMKAQVFQFSAKSIHYNIKNYADNDVDVFGSRWYVERTEEQGNYYILLNLGPVKMSPELEEQLKIAKDFKLSGDESGSVKLSEEDQVAEEA